MSDLPEAPKELQEAWDLRARYRERFGHAMPLAMAAPAQDEDDRLAREALRTGKPVPGWSAMDTEETRYADTYGKRESAQTLEPEEDGMNDPDVLRKHNRATGRAPRSQSRDESRAKRRAELMSILTDEYLKHQPSRELLAKQARLLQHLQQSASPDEPTDSLPPEPNPKG